MPDRPTYQVIGELTRFDERDTVFARERLTPGSPEEIAYHAMHPERAEIDRRLAAFIESVNSPDQNTHPLDAAFYQATFGPIAGLALPDVVDGAVAPARVDADPAHMTARIKALARHLGADDVRIGPLNPAWTYSHRGSPPFFPDYAPNPPHFQGPPADYTGWTWGDLIKVPHRQAIVMAFGQDYRLLRTGGTPFSDLEVGRVYA
ncbi:MAG: hypothetical protein KJ734_08655, partial [Chloroflexi bacterium]|nr:hypothetical protein [Chloroflexota bacterium]